jgi:hypothetical protein
MFIARNKTNPALILTAGGEWKPSRMVGPGGYTARTFRTRAGAAKHGTAEAA